MKEGKKMFFYADDAEKYGVEEAVMLANLRYWCGHNKANDRNIHPDRDGTPRAWSYNSVKAWGRQFPYWSNSKIRRILDRLYEKGAIDKGNFNKSAYDRTFWYTVLNDELICDYEQIDLPESTNGFAEGDEPIPDVLPDSKPDIKPHAQKHSRNSSDCKHETLNVPMNSTRYHTLCGKYSQAAVDTAIQERMDWEATKGKPQAKDYAAAAATWLKNSERYESKKSDTDTATLMRSLGVE